MKKKFVIFVILSTAAVVLLAAEYSSRRFSAEYDTVIAVKRSPDNRYIATILERNMGSTTNYATIVTLHSKYDLFSFNRSPTLSIDGRTPVAIHWTNAHALGISCPEAYSRRRKNADAELRTMLRKWRDVTITYSTKEKP